MNQILQFELDGRTHAGHAAAHRILAAIIAGLLVSAAPSRAVNYTWDGGGTDNNFSTTDNWNAAPVAGIANFLIFDGTTRLTPYNDLAAGTAFGGLSFAASAGNFELSGNTLRLGDGSNASLTIGSDAAGAIVVNNNLELDEAQVRFNSSSGGSLTITGLIGSPRVTHPEVIVTRGSVFLTNSGNNFNSQFSVIGGRAVVANIANSGVASAIGAGSTIRLGNAGATGNFEYTGGAVSTDRQLRIGGGDLVTHTGGGVITSSGSGAMTFSHAAFNDPVGTVIATRTLTLRGTYTGAANVIQGVIADNNTGGGGILNLAKNDAGTWRLDGVNTYSGTTTVSAGTLVAANAGALGSTAAGTTVANGATLGLQGGITTAAEALSITGAGVGSGGALRNISGDNVYAGTVTLTGAASIGSDAGNLTVSGQITGSQTLTVVGGGTVTLTSANAYTGGTTVQSGTLLVNNETGSGTGAGAVTVNSGAKLGGTGIIAGDITIQTGAILAPGASFGTLEGLNLSLQDGAKLQWELSGNATEFGNNQYDRLLLSGNLEADNKAEFDFLGTGYWSGSPTVYTLIQFAGTTGVTKDSFTIKADSLAPGLSSGGFEIVDNAGTLELQLTVIPEPASLGALGMIVLAAVLRRRLRR